jgi:ABC-type lipoprotein release transport system permease subunit
MGQGDGEAPLVLQHGAHADQPPQSQAPVSADRSLTAVGCMRGSLVATKNSVDTSRRHYTLCTPKMYVLFLGIRYLRRRFSALAALGAVTFGVATLFTVLSVMEGYKTKLRELVRGSESHLTLIGYPVLSLTGTDRLQEAIRAVPHGEATAPFIESVAMYRTFGRFSFFQLKGVDPVAEAHVGDLGKHLLRPEELDRILPPGEESLPPRSDLESRVTEVLGDGRKPLPNEEIERLFSLEWRREVLKTHSPSGRGEGREVPGAIVVGLNLLLDREIFLGDRLKLIALSPDTGKPVMGDFLVTGAFKTGQYEIDSGRAYMRLERLQNFLGLFDRQAQEFRIEGIHIALDDYRNADPVRREILLALARTFLDGKVSAFSSACAKIAASFDSARAAELAERLRSELDGVPAIPPGSIEGEILEAARRIASPQVQEDLERRIPVKVRQTIEELLPWLAEVRILSDLRRLASTRWEEAVIGKGGRSTERMEPAEALRMAAGQVVLEAAERDLASALQEIVSRPPFTIQVRTWEQQRSVLVQAVDQEKWIVSFLVFLLNVFIGFVVLLMLVLIVIEKTRDIGILLALGAKPRGVVRIFLADGLVIVALGVGLGLLGGFFFVENINRIHDAFYGLTGIRLFDPQIYQMDRIPTTVTAGQVMVSIFPSILFGFLASLIPAVWASHQDPIKAIHYE